MNSHNIANNRNVPTVMSSTAAIVSLTTCLSLLLMVTPASCTEANLTSLVKDNVTAAVTTSGDAFRDCHNVTGTCLHHGFVCANNQVVAHEARCDGVDDCADGTDEFMCHHEDKTPLHTRTHGRRHAFAQASCVNCNCETNVQTVRRGDAWFEFGINAPTDPKGLMTGSPNDYGGMPCNHRCTKALKIAFYKKNGVCRGWLCCARQRECIDCDKGGSCPDNNHPGWFSRCYKN